MPRKSSVQSRSEPKKTIPPNIDDVCMMSSFHSINTVMNFSNQTLDTTG